MTFYGGAILSFVCGFIYCRIKKVSASTLMDLAIPAGLLALSIGRIGCFLNGDDFGKAVPLKPGEAAPWWSVTFPNLEDAVPRYPVQLIEAFTVLILVLILTTAFVPLRRNFRAGAVGYFGIIGYANLRFFNEYYRGDLRGFVGNSLSTSQFISLLILAAAALSLPFWLKFKKMPDH
jgi:phosphatidylglycerol:prolipoprotein diacylglycerol transferase